MQNKICTLRNRRYRICDHCFIVLSSRDASFGSETGTCVKTSSGGHDYCQLLSESDRDIQSGHYIGESCGSLGYTLSCGFDYSGSSGANTFSKGLSSSSNKVARCYYD